MKHFNKILYRSVCQWTPCVKFSISCSIVFDTRLFNPKLNQNVQIDSCYKKEIDRLARIYRLVWTFNRCCEVYYDAQLHCRSLLLSLQYCTRSILHMIKLQFYSNVCLRVYYNRGPWNINFLRLLQALQLYNSSNFSLIIFQFLLVHTSRATVITNFFSISTLLFLVRKWSFSIPYS